MKDIYDIYVAKTTLKKGGGEPKTAKFYSVSRFLTEILGQIVGNFSIDQLVKELSKISQSQIKIVKGLSHDQLII